MALIVAFLMCRAIVTSKLGKVLIAVRDAEIRTRFLGYRVETLQAVRLHALGLHRRRRRRALCAAGRHHQSERILAGNSIEAVIWVAVGGRGTLIGAALGAVVVNYAKTLFTRAACAYWLFMLGALFVLVTLFLPKGIVGTFNAWWEPWKAARVDDAASAAREDGIEPKPNPAE